MVGMTGTTGIEIGTVTEVVDVEEEADHQEDGGGGVVGGWTTGIGGIDDHRMGDGVRDGREVGVAVVDRDLRSGGVEGRQRRHGDLYNVCTGCREYEYMNYVICAISQFCRGPKNR